MNTVATHLFVTDCQILRVVKKKVLPDNTDICIAIIEVNNGFKQKKKYINKINDDTTRILCHIALYVVCNESFAVE